MPKNNSDPNEYGTMAADVAVGIDAILVLATERETFVRSQKEGPIMRDRLQTRLGELKKEFATGQTHLQELEKQQMHLRETMLRISGAIQVLEELLAEGRPVEQNGISGENQPLSSQGNPGTIIDPVPQTSGLGDHDQGSRQNSPAMNTLGEKE